MPYIHQNLPILLRPQNNQNTSINIDNDQNIPRISKMTKIFIKPLNDQNTHKSFKMTKLVPKTPIWQNIPKTFKMIKISLKPLNDKILPETFIYNNWNIPKTLKWPKYLWNFKKINEIHHKPPKWQKYPSKTSRMIEICPKSTKLTKISLKPLKFSKYSKTSKMVGIHPKPFEWPNWGCNFKLVGNSFQWNFK